MKNAIKVASLAFFLVSLSAGELNAQSQEWWTAITYQGGLPAGDTKEFTDEFSWRGLGLEGRTMVRPNVSVGGFVGWNTFTGEEDGTVSLGGADVSGFQSRFVNAVPLLVTAHFYSNSSRRDGMMPYLGAGIGTYWIENRLELGQTALTTDNWHFGLAPEIGFLFPMEGQLIGKLSAKYNYAFEAGGITHSYWTFGIGIAASNRY
jgi:outer membrane protein W